MNEDKKGEGVMIKDGRFNIPEHQRDLLCSGPVTSGRCLAISQCLGCRSAFVALVAGVCPATLALVRHS